MNFWEKYYYGNTILDYAICLGIILGAIIVAKILYWVSSNIIKKLTAKTKTNLDDIIVDKVEEPVMFGLVIGASWWAINRLNFVKSKLTIDRYTEIYTSNYGVPPSEEHLEQVTQIDKTVEAVGGIAQPFIEYPYWENFVHHLFGFLVVVNVTWLIVRLLDALIEEYVVPLAEKTKSDLDDQLLPLFRKGMKVIIWALGIIIGLNNAGYDVGAIIAGLGIGGLAFALAAQDTVKNFFGGIMIFADKPFQIGDRIVIGGIEGVVEEIGIRSTRIKTLAGRQVTVPNSKFSDDAVENVDREPNRKVILNLGLTYDMNADQMQRGIDILKEIAAENKENLEEDISVGFNAFGDFSLGIIFIYYIKKGADILQTQTDINMMILKRFADEGLDMAFPTQTIYHQQIK
ncbi:mechanosensitive ion channel family protein [Paracrocinitomix mangrovi]|uniref:mechanosensitive ion channel family protein n=1 Tax=Paracrocinitomix mangrovi TaxID=2862509 RepID=UPI001C8D22E6|nr:mechanosensitive ion channel family protein [Paracrocinitomix mangrovi]UKN01259.1 mechanosensitive ion channel family protein [Paracrocinitomix mangrovi]